MDDPVEPIIPSGRFAKVRQFLTDNEIIFKTATATALSTMAVIVSIAQSVTAREQLSLASIQVQITRANAQPNFDISIEQKSDPATGVYTQNEMVLSNSGAPVRELVATPMFFMQAHAVLPGRDGRLIGADVPINGYYTVHFESSASKGELGRFTDRENSRRAQDLEKRASDLAKSNKWPLLDIEDLSILKITYNDIIGDAHTDYFRINSVGAASRISADYGQEMANKWKPTPLPDLWSLNAQSLLAVIVATSHPAH